MAAVKINGAAGPFAHRQVNAGVIVQVYEQFDSSKLLSNLGIPCLQRRTMLPGDPRESVLSQSSRLTQVIVTWD